MELYRNGFHSGHLYLKIEAYEVPDLPCAVFEELLEKHRKPLQVMVSSDNEQLVGILRRSGFVLKRKCYEMDVREADLVTPLSNVFPAVAEARRGTPEYAECAGKMYHYYADTHAAINPLTAARADFEEMLPDTVLYARTDDRIDSAAFVDGGEIAYVFSYRRDVFLLFADSLLANMFGRSERVFFEADDSDWAATKLKELFSVSPGVSYDTYIKTT